MRVGVDGRSLRDPGPQPRHRALSAQPAEGARAGVPRGRVRGTGPGRADSRAARARGGGPGGPRPADRQPSAVRRRGAQRPPAPRPAGGRLRLVLLPGLAPVAVSRGLPVVLTVHDLSFEHRPQDFSAYERLWHRVARPRRQARRADAADHRLRVGHAGTGPRMGHRGRPKFGPFRPGRGEPRARPPRCRPGCPSATCSPWGRSSHGSAPTSWSRHTRRPARAGSRPASS